MARVKFKDNWRFYKRDEIAIMGEIAARSMVESGVAEYVRGAPPKIDKSESVEVNVKNKEKTKSKKPKNSEISVLKTKDVKP